jgi:hypothetical protein
MQNPVGASARARREVGDDLPRLVERFKPTWLILRPPEKALWLKEGAAALADYKFVKATDALDQLARIPFLPGRGLLKYDAVFLVYHRSK